MVRHSAGSKVVISARKTNTAAPAATTSSSATASTMLMRRLALGSISAGRPAPFALGRITTSGIGMVSMNERSPDPDGAGGGRGPAKRGKLSAIPSGEKGETGRWMLPKVGSTGWTGIGPFSLVGGGLDEALVDAPDDAPDDAAAAVSDSASGLGGGGSKLRAGGGSSLTV